jgi:two-component system, OmpR family, phosphate regulon sensor histidine kinase PhoR
MEEHIYWRIFLSYAVVLAISVFMLFFFQFSAVSVLVILIITTAYSTYLASFFLTNINRLSEAIFEVSRGTFRPFVHKKTVSEFRRIEDAITELQESLQKNFKELNSSNAKLMAILSSMTEGVIAVDRAENIILINIEAQKLLGMNEPDVVDHNYIERIRQPELTNAIKTALAGHSTHDLQMKLAVPEEKILLVHAVPVTNGGAVVVLTDITRLKMLEAVRSEFTANVSHELKTPLTSIISSTETLLEGAVNDKDHNIGFLTKIMNNSGRLAALIDDILELSSLDEKKLPRETGSVNVKDIIDRAVDVIASKIEAKHIKLAVDLENDAMSVKAIEDHIFRVFLNLMDNAVKYNKQDGEVKISASYDGDDIRFIVSDTGIGIDEKHLPRIFERFFTVDKARSRELGGTGLGLAIVKHIVELYGGKISVSSDPGLGSVFTFTLKKA